jgi:prefoldin subunit 4
MQKDKEDLEEISSELELADEEEKVPYVCLPARPAQPSPARLLSLWLLADTLLCDGVLDARRYINKSSPSSRYKIGDSFFNLPVPEVQELLSAAVERIDGEVSSVEEKLGEYREEMQSLKTDLYGRFGKSINLEV